MFYEIFSHVMCLNAKLQKNRSITYPVFDTKYLINIYAILDKLLMEKHM